MIFWVDGSDIKWQEKKARYGGHTFQNTDVRYRDWDILKYWFRAVERFAPWVHHVYFVADNQRPEWLNWSNPKLSYIDHQDFIPHEFLPTFQANTIELNIHRIKGLSEHFVVFNDDMFINAPITPNYYFKLGLPCDAPYEHVFNGKCYSKIDKWGINIMEFCDTHVINAHFDRCKTVRSKKKAWLGSYLGVKYQLQAWLISLFGRTEFQHFYTPHNEKAFLKEIYDEVWQVEPDVLKASCSKFREDVSVNNYLMRYWQLVSNRFYPHNDIECKKVIQLHKENMKQLETILFDCQVKSLCVNDSSDCSYEEYMKLKIKVNLLFEKKYPVKSEFEI